MVAEVFFVGCHVYDSRVTRDGYTEDDVLQQIKASMAEESVLLVSQKMTVLQNPAKRADGYSRRVHDQAVLECSTRHPNPVLYSVIPKGDSIPLLKAIEPPEAALLEEVTNSPG